MSSSGQRDPGTRTPSTTIIPRNLDGRPIWEPPILSYAELIDEEYEKKQEVVLKCTNGNRARTTEIMDAIVEVNLHWKYIDWAVENVISAPTLEDAEYFEKLAEELETDGIETKLRWAEQHVALLHNDDGTYTAFYYLMGALTHEEDDEWLYRLARGQRGVLRWSRADGLFNIMFSYPLAISTGSLLRRRFTRPFEKRHSLAPDPEIEIPID